MGILFLLLLEILFFQHEKMDLQLDKTKYNTAYKKSFRHEIHKKLHAYLVLQPSKSGPQRQTSKMIYRVSRLLTMSDKNNKTVN